MNPIEFPEQNSTFAKTSQSICRSLDSWSRMGA